jgi:hypothetical protein
MRAAGEICLLAAFVASGFAALAGMAAWRRDHRALRRVATVAAWTSLLAVTAVVLILGRALLEKDFGFAYVAQYSSTLLPWYFSLSAFWVGQAGSLLLWSGLRRIARHGRRAAGQASPCASFAPSSWATSVFAGHHGVRGRSAGSEHLPRETAWAQLCCSTQRSHPPIVFWDMWTVPVPWRVAWWRAADDGWARGPAPRWRRSTGVDPLGAEWSYEN